MEVMIDRIANYLGNAANLNEQDKESLKYSIYVIWANVSKLVIFTIVAVYIGQLKNYIILMAVAGIYKYSFGGIHLKTYMGCLIYSFINIFGILYIVPIVHINTYVKMIVFLLAMVSVYKYAPADTEYRPILSKKERNKFRIISISLIIVSIPMALTLSEVYSNIIILSLILAIILINPLTYKLLRVNYGDKY